VPDGEYVRRVERLGGEQNAFTGADFTAYYATIAKEHLPEVMKLEADRMQNLAPQEALYASEREVIIEERRMRVDNRPESLLSEKMAAAQFGAHPYGTPIIGWAKEMAGLNAQHVQAYYRAHYHPGAAVLVLVGDITEAEARPLVEKYYGKWERRESTPRAWQEFTLQTKHIHVKQEHQEVHQELLMREYIAPSFGYGNKKTTFSLMILEELLGNGRTGWLYQRLVTQRKLAVAASASYRAEALGPSTFAVVLAPAPGVSLEALEAALDEELAAFLARDIAPRDAERARNSLKAGHIYVRDGVEGMAYALGQWMMLGLDVDFFNAWPRKIDAVRVADIRRAAQETLVEKHSVTGYLSPGSES
jgi:zinc protease